MGWQSADTKASSSQSAMRKRGEILSDGLSPSEAIEKYPTLTEFEKIEMGMFERIFTIGKVRRSN